jgi:hypothetical protein
MKDLPVVIQSPADTREYSSFELDNGLRVVIIRDPEIKGDDKECPVVARKACQSTSGSSDCSSEESFSGEVCILIEIWIPIMEKIWIWSGTRRSNDPLALYGKEKLSTDAYYF